MALVKNAGSAWKWFSVQAMALAGAINATWVSLPADLQARVPETVVDYMTIALMVLGIFGRVVDQGGGQ